MSDNGSAHLYHDRRRLVEYKHTLSFILSRFTAPVGYHLISPLYHCRQCGNQVGLFINKNRCATHKNRIITKYIYLFIYAGWHSLINIKNSMKNNGSRYYKTNKGATFCTTFTNVTVFDYAFKRFVDLFRIVYWTCIIL